MVGRTGRTRNEIIQIVSTIVTTRRERGLTAAGLLQYHSLDYIVSWQIYESMAT